MLLIFLGLIAGCTFFRPSPAKLYKRALQNSPYDVIIVPGVPFNGQQWSFAMKGRVIWAYYLFKKGITSNIIFSGGAVYTPYTEAKIMALYAHALGVPESNIFMETKAEHSTENVYYSYKMANDLGFTKIAVASDPFQSNILMRFTKKNFKQPSITHIPFVVDSLSTMHDVNPLINADSAKVDNFKSIVEKQTKWYRLKGTLGKNIPFEKNKTF